MADAGAWTRTLDSPEGKNIRKIVNNAASARTGGLPWIVVLPVAVGVTMNLVMNMRTMLVKRTGFHGGKEQNKAHHK
ncbi:hypothetical protein ACFX2I_044990 [Malus domestica]